MTDMKHWRQRCYDRVDALGMRSDSTIPAAETMACMIFDAYFEHRTKDAPMPVELLAAADQYRKQIWPLSDRYAETTSDLADTDPVPDTDPTVHDLAGMSVHGGAYTTAILEIVKEVIPPGFPFGISIRTAGGAFDERLFAGLYVLHSVLDARPPHLWHWPRPRVIANMVAGFEAVECLWQAVEDTAGLDYPLNDFIDYALGCLQRQDESPENANVLTCGRGNLARIANGAKTTALAEWQQLPDAAVVEVDGQPVSTPLHYAPRRARRKRREAGTLMPLPGTAQAGDVRLALLQDLEQHAGIDRRNPLSGDTLYVLTLGMALTGPVTLHVDQLGAMMAGQFAPAGAQPSQRERWRERAWAAVRWASSWRKLPSGHWRQLLGITTADLTEGYVRIYPFRWDQHGKGYRLTGVLTNQAVRQDKSGSLGRLIAGIEDYIAAAPAPAHDRRSRLLIPDKKGGPGPTSELIPYPVILARAGFYFDLIDRRSRNTTAELWRRISGAVAERGYVLPRLSAEAEAGDTVEVVEIVKGNRSGIGGIRVRASARLIEAQSLVSRNKVARGLTSTPLARLFD
ncbi:MAG: hypothetical protein OXH53_07065 [bacterium]|nr:hypothetical protein [bacterium]MCY3631677.1 hypothetical protein [bacterium]